MLKSECCQLRAALVAAEKKLDGTLHDLENERNRRQQAEDVQFIVFPKAEQLDYQGRLIVDSPSFTLSCRLTLSGPNKTHSVLVPLDENAIRSLAAHSSRNPKQQFAAAAERSASSWT
jgi:hypothetical protein